MMKKILPLCSERRHAMPDNRFFYPDDLKKGAEIFLRDFEMHHMVKVMRRQKGDWVELVNGLGVLARGQIERIDRDRAHILIMEADQGPPLKRQLILAQALLKPSLLDLVIEKGTELGATAFWLFPAERSEKKELSQNQLKRFQLLCISALKQSGRLFLPNFELKPPLSEWEKPPFPLFFGDPAGPLIKRPESGVIILVGPGKGLSVNERTYLTDSLGATGVSLNPYILRAETAALCALSLLA